MINQSRIEIKKLKSKLKSVVKKVKSFKNFPVNSV